MLDYDDDEKKWVILSTELDRNEMVKINLQTAIDMILLMCFKAQPQITLTHYVV